MRGPLMSHWQVPAYLTSNRLFAVPTIKGLKADLAMVEDDLPTEAIDLAIEATASKRHDARVDVTVKTALFYSRYLHSTWGEEKDEDARMAVFALFLDLALDHREKRYGPFQSLGSGSKKSADWGAWKAAAHEAIKVLMSRVGNGIFFVGCSKDHAMIEFGSPGYINYFWSQSLHKEDAEDFCGKMFLAKAGLAPEVKAVLDTLPVQVSMESPWGACYGQFARIRP